MESRRGRLNVAVRAYVQNAPLPEREGGEESLSMFWREALAEDIQYFALKVIE